MVMGFDSPIPSSRVLAELPRLAFPPLSPEEISFLMGREWTSRQYLKDLLEDYGNRFMGAAKRYQAQKWQHLRMAINQSKPIEPWEFKRSEPDAIL